MRTQKREAVCLGDVIRGIQERTNVVVAELLDRLNISEEPTALNNDEADAFYEERLANDTRPLWQKLLFLYDPEEEDTEDDQFYYENDIIDFDSARLREVAKRDVLSKSKNNA